MADHRRWRSRSAWACCSRSRDGGITGMSYEPPRTESRPMRGPPVRPVVIAAGGTGGHFFPAEALASELIARGHRIVLMADARSGGLSSAVFAGHECFVIRGAGIAGRGALHGSKAVLSLTAGIAQARRIL